MLYCSSRPAQAGRLRVFLARPCACYCTRPAARRYFNVDAESVVVQSLQALADAGQVPHEKVAHAFHAYAIDDPTAVSGVKQEGGDA